MSQPQPPSAPPRSKVAFFLALAFSLLVLAAVITAPIVTELVGTGEDSHASSGAPEASDTPMSEVETFDITDRTHVTEPVDYDQSPPAGGPHSAEWLECGTYDEPVPLENVVHDLEHGTVWITYDADQVDADGVAQLTEQLPANGILSPYDDLDAPVVVTVWNAQLRLTGPDDAGLQAFIDGYGDGHTSAEPNVGCFGGTADVDASDGPGGTDV